MKLLKALALKYMSRKLKVLTFLLITSSAVFETHCIYLIVDPTAESILTVKNNSTSNFVTSSDQARWKDFATQSRSYDRYQISVLIFE